MSILVTGAAGYIGAHAIKRLLDDHARVVGIDNFSIGSPEAIEALRTLPEATPGRFVFERCDIADHDRVEALLREHEVDAVMHFAAFADLRESMTQPLRYFRNNTASAIALLEACDAANVSRFVFSSTCATYGELSPADVPVSEDYPNRNPINPYGHSKLAFEWTLEDYADACQRKGRPFALAILRYFNVAGCDMRGLLGEHRNPHIRIIPILIEAALGRREGLTIFGTDYPTPDGTCIRDYIHVDDLVDAHARVLQAPGQGNEKRIYNLGIGRAHSIRELIDATERVTGATLHVTEGPRAPGDPAQLCCDASRIRRDLGWEARMTDLDEIIGSAYRWMRAHPDGYEATRP